MRDDEIAVRTKIQISYVEVQFLLEKMDNLGQHLMKERRKIEKSI